MRCRFSYYIACALIATARSFAADSIIETGEIAGAKFTLARPAQWNHRLLLLAHGLRSEDRPVVADLFPDHLACKTLLAEGWIVAKTSYRRNGMIIADAVADLDALRAHIAEKYGPPRRVLVEGESMGGLIATLIAEREPLDAPLYHGAIAIGAALHAREPSALELELSRRPRIPLLFLTNQSELDGPENYVSGVKPDEPSIPPALFRVSRDGHVNVNQAERLLALRALNAWLDRGRAALPSPPENQPAFDATVQAAPAPSQVALHADTRGFDARVIEVSAVYGNVFIDAQPDDFAAAGIPPMTYFLASAGRQTFRILYGRDFNSVKRAQWVAFPNADGYFWLARNFADAAATANLKPGDLVVIRRADYPKSATPPPEP